MPGRVGHALLTEKLSCFNVSTPGTMTRSFAATPKPQITVPFELDTVPPSWKSGHLTPGMMSVSFNLLVVANAVSVQSSGPV